MGKMLPDSSCPNCHKLLNAASFLGDEKKIPKPKDLSVCVYCATPLRYKEDLSLELLPEEEFQELQGSEIEKLREMIQLIKIKNFSEIPGILGKVKIKGTYP
jgi:hypothetical protein